MTVGPLLEYAACIWDPYQEYLICEIEKIQRRDARWELSDYNCYSSVTEMLNSLEWSTLESKRYNSRLSQLYKIMHHHTPAYHTSAAILSANTTSNKTPPPALFYNASYIHYYLSAKLFPKTINQWNNLPNNIIESSLIQYFMAAITTEQV